MSQEQTILKALMAGERLTVLDAINKYGCYALSQRCGELRREGHPIKAEMIELPNKKRVAQYRWEAA